MASSLKIFVEAASGQFERAMLGATYDVKVASMKTMHMAADIAKPMARAEIAAAGFSLKWQNAMRTVVYPQGNVISAQPTLQVYSKIGYSGIFEDGGEIFGNPYLWLPLPDAPMGSGGRRIAPADYRSKVGHPLYSIKRAGKPPLLGAYVRVTDTRAKGISLTLLKRGRNPTGRGTERLVPLYFGIAKVAIGDKFNIREAMERVAAQLPEIYASVWNEGG
ncbi:DUF6441 family protein [Mesorhizobium sp. B4-1-1]|uniref:DUF6441 family protein n=1 Tax=Mesorhizobium sp. B4-1-1 TaxID=2589890 RepID=UPI0011286E1A|nr:DUF6441 family protein [Mesorhizobium sp. B4-1-1]TPI13870.1 hypothetical protein FJW10_25695 [Mesorhizobium sp. B4-1-1]